MNKKDLKTLLTQCLEPLGFSSDKHTFYRRAGELFLGFEIDKSPYGGLFEIDIGVYVDETGDLIHPPGYTHWHIKDHLTRIVPAAFRKELCDALYFEIAMPKEQRCAVIRKGILEYGLPYLESLSSIDKIISRLDDPTKGWVHATGEMHELLYRRTGWKPPKS